MARRKRAVALCGSILLLIAFALPLFRWHVRHFLTKEMQVRNDSLFDFAIGQALDTTIRRLDLPGQPTSHEGPFGGDLAQSLAVTTILVSIVHLTLVVTRARSRAPYTFAIAGIAIASLMLWLIRARDQMNATADDLGAKPWEKLELSPVPAAVILATTYLSMRLVPPPNKFREALDSF